MSYQPIFLVLILLFIPINLANSAGRPLIFSAFPCTMKTLLGQAGGRSVFSNREESPDFVTVVGNTHRE